MNLPKDMPDDYTLSFSPSEFKQICDGFLNMAGAMKVLNDVAEEESRTFCMHFCPRVNKLLQEVSSISTEKELLSSDSRLREERLKKLSDSLEEKDAEIQSLKERIYELNRAQEILERDYAELELKYHFGDDADDAKQEHSCECGGSCKCQ